MVRRLGRRSKGGRRHGKEAEDEQTEEERGRRHEKEERRKKQEGARSKKQEGARSKKQEGARSKKQEGARSKKKGERRKRKLSRGAMPKPSLATLRRREVAMKERKLRDLVSGNGSLRIVVRALNSKSQQQLADRMHFIENLGKSDVKAAFKGIGVARQQQDRKRKKRQSILRRMNEAAPVDTNDYGIKTFGTIPLDDLENNPALAVLAARRCAPGQNGKIFRAPVQEIRFRRALHPRKFCAKVKPSRQQDPIGGISRRERSVGERRPHTSPERVRLTQHCLERRPHTMGCARQTTETLHSPSDPFGGKLGWAGLFAPAGKDPDSFYLPHVLESRPQTTDTEMGSALPDATGSRPPTQGGVGGFSRPGTAARPGTGFGSRPQTTKTGVAEEPAADAFPRVIQSASELVRRSRIHSQKKQRRGPVIRLRPGTGGHINWSRDRRNDKVFGRGMNLAKGTKKVLRKQERARKRRWQAAESDRRARQAEYEACLHEVRVLTENSTFR